MTEKPQYLIVALLVGLARRTGRAYVFPAQETIIKMLQKSYNITMSRATLNRHLKALECMGWFRRQRRHKKAADGSLEMHSTLYTLAREAFHMFGARFAAPVDKLKSRVNNSLSYAVSIMGQKNPKGENKEENHQQTAAARPLSDLMAAFAARMRV